MAKTVLAKELKPNTFYKTSIDLLFSHVDDVDYLTKEDLDLFNKLGYIKNREIIFPKGTPIKFIGNFGGGKNFEVASVSLDMLVEPEMFEEI